MVLQRINKKRINKNVGLSYNYETIEWAREYFPDFFAHNNGNICYDLRMSAILQASTLRT